MYVFYVQHLIRRSKRLETVRNISTIAKEVTVWNITYKYIFHVLYTKDIYIQKDIFFLEKKFAQTIIQEHKIS